MGDAKPRILFLCTGNSCRSQMAEGWARRLHGDRYEVHSSGLVAHGKNAQAIEAMAALGVDIDAQESTAFAAVADVEFDLVVTVCDHAAGNLPALRGNPTRVHQPFPDPPAMAAGREAAESEACYREVAASIRDWVRTLPEQLEA